MCYFVKSTHNTKKSVIYFYCLPRLLIAVRHMQILAATLFFIAGLFGWPWWLGLIYACSNGAFVGFGSGKAEGVLFGFGAGLAFALLPFGLGALAGGLFL